MSSRLFEGGAGVEAQPMVWRPTGAPRPAAKPSGSAQAAATIDVDEAVLKEAYAKGMAAGEAAGFQRASDRLTPVLASLSAMIQELAGVRNQFRMQAEASTVELAMAIARRVLHREVATDPEAILGLVKSAAQRLSAREIHRLRVAPSDAAFLNEHRGRMSLPVGVEIAGDTQLIPGSAIFETTRGEMDASVGTQLDEIQRGLADVMRRRNR